jgi:hypothetical protein
MFLISWIAENFSTLFLIAANWMGIVNGGRGCKIVDQIGAGLLAALIVWMYGVARDWDRKILRTDDSPRALAPWLAIALQFGAALTMWMFELTVSRTHIRPFFSHWPFTCSFEP